MMPVDTTSEPRRLNHRVVEWQDPGVSSQAAEDMHGLAFLRSLKAGDISPSPLVAFLGIELVEVDPGRAVLRMDLGDHLHNLIGSVHGGAVASMFDCAMDYAVRSMLPRARAYTALEIKVNLFREIKVASGPLRAIGETIHIGDRHAAAEAKLYDEAGSLRATASTTFLFLDASVRGDAPPVEPDPILAGWLRIS